MAQGDFGVEVPTEGSDEFAALGIEFNEMARQLEGRLEELADSSASACATAIQRVGQSFGKTLERDALLEIVVQTAVDGVGAEAGRAALRTESHGRFEEIAGEGDVNRYRDVIGAAEAAALEAGTTGRDGASATPTRSRTRCARRTAGGSSACCRSPAPARRSPPASASCSATSPARRASRSRTRTCTTRSSARRSPTS